MVQHGTGGDMAAGPDDGVSNYSTRIDHRAGADDGVFEISRAGDFRPCVDGGGEVEFLVGLEVGFSVAEIQPDTLIKRDGA